MIELRSLLFGRFTEIEPLNRSFVPGHPKLKMTVDTEGTPSVPDVALLERLAEAFPRLEGHRCRAPSDSSGSAAAGTRILLLDADSSANQAHLLEHLTLEMLSTLDHEQRLSGVTCAYAAPAERNDVFVECSEPEWGLFAAMLAVEAMNAALAHDPLAPLYPDVLSCSQVMRGEPVGVWSPMLLGHLAGIANDRARSALDVLERASLVGREEFSINLSGEPYYRLRRQRALPGHDR